MSQKEVFLGRGSTADLTRDETAKERLRGANLAAWVPRIAVTRLTARAEGEGAVISQGAEDEAVGRGGHDPRGHHA